MRRNAARKTFIPIQETRKTPSTQTYSTDENRQRLRENTGNIYKPKKGANEPNEQDTAGTNELNQGNQGKKLMAGKLNKRERDTGNRNRITPPS